MFPVIPWVRLSSLGLTALIVSGCSQTASIPPCTPTFYFHSSNLQDGLLVLPGNQTAIFDIGQNGCYSKSPVTVTVDGDPAIQTKVTQIDSPPGGRNPYEHRYTLTMTIPADLSSGNHVVTVKVTIGPSAISTAASQSVPFTLHVPQPSPVLTPGIVTLKRIGNLGEATISGSPVIDGLETTKSRIFPTLVNAPAGLRIAGYGDPLYIRNDGLVMGNLALESENLAPGDYPMTLQLTTGYDYWADYQLLADHVDIPLTVRVPAP